MRRLWVIIALVALSGCLPFPEDSADDPDATSIVIDRDAAPGDADGNVQTGDAGEPDAGDLGPDAGDPGPDAGIDPKDWIQVVAGRDHACGLKGEGTVYCWGRRDQGQFAGGPDWAAAPTLIDFGEPVTIEQISSHHGRSDGAGGGTTCAVDDSNTIWCWGRNDGEVVHPDGLPRSSPMRLTGGTFERVDVGGNHACAIERSGGVQCWGANAKGQSGDTPDDPVVSFAQRADGPTAVLQVVAGDQVSYARTGPSLWAWGNVAAHAVQCNVNCAVSLVVECSCPTVIDTGVVTDLDAGATHACAIIDERLECWGTNRTLQLGTQETGATTFVMATPLFMEQDVIGAFAVGMEHTCADVNGTLECWGSNESRALGPPFAEAVNASASSDSVGLTSPTSIAAGAQFTCAIVDGEIFCWGDNSHRQLGRGSNAVSGEYETPLPVADPN